MSGRAQYAGESPQRRVDRLRATLLGGRGPGATAIELAEHQHERTQVGGVPVTVEREWVSMRARAARRDVGADTTARRVTSDRDVTPGAGHTPKPVLAPVAAGVLLGAAATVFAHRLLGRASGKR